MMFRAVILALATLGAISVGAATTDSTKRWVGTWSTAPQLVESANMPPSPGLSNNSLRQIVRVSIGGDTVRLKFSNDFSTSATTLKAVTIAASTGKGAVTASTMKTLTFGGSPSVTMNASASVMSDPVAFALTPRMDVAITIYYGTASSSVSGHPGSRTTSYLLAGDKSTAATFSGATSTEHWYNINTIDVLVPKSAASVAILANSIADGRGSTTDMQNRWPDIFSEALLKNTATSQVGVLNLGIGGNCVLSGGLGPTGVSRYQRDILDQRGLQWVIVSEGVNDIGGVSSASAATTTANNLINAYKKFIADAHAKNLKVYGATIMPFNGNSYYNASSESCRSTVNKWIRTPGNYDAVIDFDKIMRSTSDTTKLGVTTFQNDGLHPDAAAYKKMGESIDLGLFVPSSSEIVGRGTSRKSPSTTNSGITLRFDGKSMGVEYKGRRVDGRNDASH
jgi:lysophospholipase L1-like esterase